MIKISFLISLCLSLITTAHAIKGTYASKEYELAQTCKLTFSVEVEGKIYQGICTASFLGNQTFSTAEHCDQAVTENFSLMAAKKVTEAPYFECPGIERKISVTKTYPIKDAKFSEHQDIALMKVSDPLPDLAPMKIPNSSEHVEKLMEDPTKCYINGYGRDNEEKHGVLKAAQVVEWDAKPLSFFGGSTQAFKLTKNYAQHGDSGGPMYCMDGQTPVLVGVVHGGMNGGNFSTIEKFTKVIDWIHLVKDSPDPQIDDFNAVLKMQDTCSAVGECFAKLEAAAKLSSDMKKIFEKLSEDLKDMKSQMVQGKNLESKTIDEVWDALAEEWQKNNCYKVLYP